MRIFSAFLALLLSALLAMGQGGYIGPKGYIGSKGHIGATPASGANTWTVVQHPNKINCSVASTGATQTFGCNVSVTSITAGNAYLVLAVASSNGATFNTLPTFSSLSETGGSDTPTHCPAQYEATATGAGGAVDCAYMLNSGGSVTAINWVWTFNLAVSTFDSDVEIIELHPSSTTAVFDACTTGSSCIAVSTSCTTCAVPTFSITGTSDYCVQWMAAWNSATNSISGAAYTHPYDQDTTQIGAAWAGALNQSSVVPQNWSIAAADIVEAGVCLK